ncbi:hypothetical protein [Halostreptopolyspora alba]|uniref:hypothetical protein n=1 Tax=Halostreptopolyspora alba TaxID=2487137 RepID=UPI002695806E
MPLPPIEAFLLAIGVGLALAAITTVVTGGPLSSNAVVGVVVAVLIATVLHA